jgi:hypothetical protein
MSDPNHPQDQPEPSRVPLPRDKELEDELQRVKEGLEAPREDKPVAPSGLENLDDIELELGRETVRDKRFKTKRLKEEVRNIGFSRTLVVAVLSILGLVALGSLAVIATGFATGMYPLAASGLATLSGSGGGGVLVYRTYMKSLLSKPEPEPTGEDP